MNGFLDQLGEELRALAAPAPASASASPPCGVPRPRSSRPRRTALTVALTATVVVALGTLPWVAERTERLSPLDAPVANAAAHAGRPGIPPADRYDLARSRSFPTPDGPGFVVNSDDGRRRCLVIPDRLIPNSFGNSCVPVAKAEREGTLGAMVEAATAERDGRTLAAFLLPKGTSPDVKVMSEGAPIPVAVEQGVLVAVLRDRATIAYRVRGRNLTQVVPAPFRDTGQGAVQCADGRMVELVLPARPSSQGAPPRVDAARRCEEG